MRKIYAAAVREYRTTALTKAFLFGAVIFPLLIWGAFIGVAATGLLSSEKPPLEGTVAIIDRTEGGVVASRLPDRFDPEKLAEERAQKIAEARRRLEPYEALIGQERIEQGFEAARAQGLFGQDPKVVVELLAEGTDVESAQRRVGVDLAALVVIGEESLLLPADGAGASPAAPEEGAGDETGAPGGRGPAEQARPDAAPERGVFSFFHAKDLDPDHVKQIRRAVSDTIQEQRYRRAGIDPLMVSAIESNPPVGYIRSIDASGRESVSSEEFTEFLPFVFMMLLFMSVITGGQYLLMGTLEEKGSRVMEVLLSAVSPLQLLVGKLLGQGVVGLTILVIYSALGVAIADRFNMLSLVPTAQIPWLVVYFVMAYAFLGSMMVSVGAAVTEIREAQALYAPITVTMMLPFVLMIPIMQNPTSVVARVFSYFPPTTPFVMVMRLSAPAHPVPVWEIALSIVVGFAGVAAAVWIAAKIFRVGVLMYGKPPTFLTLVKWIRYA